MKAVICLLFFSINAVFASSKYSTAYPFYIFTIFMGILSTHQNFKNVSGEWIKIGTKHYSFNTDRKNYTDARASCIEQGGRLFEPRDESTNSDVIKAANDIFIFYNHGFWFGINDFLLENHFVYTSSEEPLTWTNWSLDQPDDDLDNEDCGEILSNGKWNDYHCYLGMTYVCEKDDDPFTRK